VGADARHLDAVFWRALVEASPDVLLIVDPTGTILFVNQVVPALAGRTIVGAKIWDFAVGDARARLTAKVREVVETGKASVYENPGFRHDGSPGWYEVRAIPVAVEGRVDRVLWVSTDITVRKAEEDRLAFQAQVLQQVSQPVVATDSPGNVTFWNEAAECLFGYSVEEALGQNAETLLRTRWLPGGREAMLAALRSPAGAWRGELTLTDKTSDHVVVEVSTRVVRDASGATLRSITVMQDVTARKHLEEQLRQSQKMEAIGLLAGGVAHDFNNLLAVILGFSELASRKLPPGHPVAQQLAEVFEAARRGGELTRKLLAFSRKQIIQLRPVDVGASVDEFTRMIQRIVGEDVELVVERTSEPLSVQADPVQLEQVLLNLCTNARQAMPAGGKLRLTTRAVQFDPAFVARHPWARVGSFAEIAVSDTGSGMDASTRERIFEPFFTTKREGTGLGLATVYGIVQQHGGFLHVESSPGQGTTFHVFLPQASGLATDGPEMNGAPPEARALRGHELVLVAEDEPALRALVITTLTELGYRVVPAGDGEEAVRAFEQRSSDIALVLLDVVMPRLDAREAYERILEIRPDVRVLFTTGYAPASTRLAQLLESGRVPVLEKPFTPHALAAKVRSAIDGP
jgi:PAS domain S-box-containing protein